MNESPQAVRMELAFTGTGLQLFGWGLLAIALSALVIPAAWGSVPLLAWFIRNVRISDGTKMEFNGRPKEAWVLFAALMFLTYLPRLGKMASEGRQETAVFVLSLLLIPLSVALWLAILRWAVSRIQVGGGEPEMRFTGGYLGLLGWQALLGVSFVSIIGWAWAMTGLTRWICGNIEAEDLIVSFEGCGLDLLWRGILAFVPVGIVLATPALIYLLLRNMLFPWLAVLKALILIAILGGPWIWVWLMRWFVRNTYIYRRI